MKRLAILSYDYPPNDGGISRLASAMVEGLVRRGVTVEVLTREIDGRTGPPRPAVPAHEIKWAPLRREWETWRYLRRLSPRTPVLATLWNPEATMAWLACRGPRFVLAHGNEVMPYREGLRLGIKNKLRRTVLGGAEVVICNSRYTAGLVYAIQPAARTEVVCPGVDVERFAVPLNRRDVRARFGLPHDKRVVLSVSRLSAYKAHDVVLKALASLPEPVKRNLHYAVAGKGDQDRALKRMAVELGLQPYVSWLGFVDDDELPRLYCASDLFVLCTREDTDTRGVEGFGMVFLEAQAAGLAVLGTRAGGIPDAICEGQGGWLVDQDDARAVAGHLRRLAEDARGFREQGRIGQERVRRDASWEVYVERLMALMGHACV